MSYKTKLKKIKNFVFDVDGVFTDGSIIVDSEASPIDTCGADIQTGLRTRHS